MDAARVIRSKNSGPFELTLDIMFRDRSTFDLFKRRGFIDARLVARLYGVREGEI